jgi:hypothetical protein
MFSVNGFDTVICSLAYTNDILPIGKIPIIFMIRGSNVLEA